MDAQAIKKLSPAQLQALLAGVPPTGVEPNFIDPPTLVPAIVGVGTPFLALALFCFSIRAWTKLNINKSLSWDDLTCTLGFLFALAMYGGIITGCAKGALGRHGWDVTLAKALNHASLAENYITTTMAVPALGLIKSSLFIQYYTLFWPLRWVRISVWIGASISTVFYIVCSIAAFILNSPWPGESLLDAVLSSHFYTFSRFSIAIGVFGMLVDTYLLVLPIKAVLGLNMPSRKKIGVTIVFLTGTIAVVASITGLYYRVKLQKSHNYDGQWKVSYVHIWGQVESFAGVACSSMPAVYKFFAHYNFSVDSLKSSVQNLSHLLKSNRTCVEHPIYHQNPIWSTQSQDKLWPRANYSLDTIHPTGESEGKGNSRIHGSTS